MFFNLKSPVAILGFGTEGREALKFLESQGIQDITIVDQNPETVLPSEIKSKLGPDAFERLNQFKTLIRSPGIPFKIPAIQAALKAGAEITSMTKLTLQLAADRLTAVTGTNGKTTTTTLVGRILAAHYGSEFIEGGNGRKPMLQEALEHPAWPVLLEASSFQFEDAKQSPHIATITNITPDHLNWHETMEEYIAAKTNILRHQEKGDWAVLNANDENVADLASLTPAHLFWVGQRKGKQWVAWEKENLVLSFEGKTETILHRDQLIAKTHLDNWLFAAALSALHSVPVSTVAEQMRLFRGVEQRLQYIRTVRDIHFYNDSACTSPEAALVALSQFDPQKLILLLGGSSKKANFDTLAKAIVQNGIRVCLYGEESPRIQKSIEKADGGNLILVCDQSKDFRGIVTSVFHQAKPEDNVVLSPACASFDLFKNSKERGYMFDKIVDSLS